MRFKKHRHGGSNEIKRPVLLPKRVVHKTILLNAAKGLFELNIIQIKSDCFALIGL